MKRIFLALTFTLSLLTLQANDNPKYNWKQVDNDPMKTRIYKLQNGLTIYLSDNPEQPRIQTYIAVRAGGKNDPAESTGLAHYLEHLMFKGTSLFGTQNYAAERPLLDQIEAQYEVYGHTTDPEQRKAIYHIIDSLSYAASQHAIANEYDKLMAGIGSEGSNAYTSEDVTCYVEDIPANEVDRWAKIQSNRFQDLVIRGFHTELEAVYEEYNIHLTSDIDKILESLNQSLYPHHPYGTQTVIGTQEHLKNPSLENVKRFHQQWYVPNNVAICMSGDLGNNPDSIVAIIDKHFGSWKPNTHLPTLNFPAESPITSPIVKKVTGREREMVVLAWRMPRINDKDYDKMEVLSSLLYNEKSGLFDLNLNQSQQVMAVQAFENGMADYSEFIVLGLPKDGQTMEQVKDLMLEEIAKLKKGDFPESMLQAIVNNMKRNYMKGLESNESRAGRMVNAFVNRVEWKDAVERIDRIEKLTKQDIIDFAGKYLTDGYVCVYKEQGEDPNEKKIEKPAISPIEMNRDKQSAFVTEVLNTPVKDIAPKFIDFGKDMSVTTLKNGNTLLYKHNDDNELFQISYIIERGSKQDMALDLASAYLNYLGAGKLSAEELQSELYRLACDININVNQDRTHISISGLQENMKAAMRLAEDWIYKSQPDEEVLSEMVEDIMKSREDDKLEQKTNDSRLRAYGVYGADNAQTHILSAEQMKAITPAELLQALRSLKDYEQTICYYGPASQKEFEKLLSAHKTSKTPTHANVAENHYKSIPVTESEVIIAPYDAKNIYMTSYCNNGQVYDPKMEASIDLFNEYFGGGMNTVVFQELREARGLAYSAYAVYNTPSYKGDTNDFYEVIITQNDKMTDALSVFNDITEQLPLSEASFQLAKEAILKRTATQRTTRANVFSLYLDLRDKGLSTDSDPREQKYNETKKMTIQDLQNFHQQNVKGRTYRHLILGDEKELDIETLKKLGKIKRVTTEEIFGY